MVLLAASAAPPLRSTSFAARAAALAGPGRVLTSLVERPAASARTSQAVLAAKGAESQLLMLREATFLFHKISHSGLVNYFVNSILPCMSSTTD